ncbi:hypothetical protein D9M68_444460 [compost metagenome]
MEGDPAVHHSHLVEGEGQQLVQLVAPVRAGTGLGLILVGAAIDEVQLRRREDHPCDDGMVIPEGVPAHRQVDARRIQQRHRHLAVYLDDGQAVDTVGAAPPGEVDVGDPAAILAHVGELAVEVVANQPGQDQVGYHQQQEEGQDRIE